MLIDSFCRQVLDKNIEEDNREILLLDKSTIDLDLYNICQKRIPCKISLNKELVESLNLHLADEETLYYDCIRKTLFIGNKDYKSLKQGNLELSGSILYKDGYNIPEFITIQDKSLLTKELPRFKEYKNIKYSKIKKSIFKEFNLGNNKYQVFLTNIPYEYYRNHIILKAPVFMYNYLQNKYTVGINENDFDNNDSIETHIDSIVENGMFKSLNFRLLNKGNLLNIQSYNRLIIARILGLPSIPAYIVSGNDNSSDDYFDLKDLSLYANEVFNPYFVFL